MALEWSQSQILHIGGTLLFLHSLLELVLESESIIIPLRFMHFGLCSLLRACDVKFLMCQVKTMVFWYYYCTL